MAPAFFYGILMHPKILKRVIGHDGSQLQIRPALLLDYTRHKVKDADYPGIVPYAQSRDMFGRDLTPEERSVRGSLVTGLSDEDMKLLDVLEGDEYNRKQVLVYPLGPPVALDDLEATGVVPKVSPQIPPPNDFSSPLQANAYVWCSGLSSLHPTLWSFEEFVKESARKWIGHGSEGNEHYTEVDRRRGMKGVIVRTAKL